MNQALTAEGAEVFAEVTEKNPSASSAKTSASFAVKDFPESHTHNPGHALGIHFAAKVEIQFLELARHRFKQQTLFF